MPSTITVVPADFTGLTTTDPNFVQLEQELLLQGSPGNDPENNCAVVQLTGGDMGGANSWDISFAGTVVKGDISATLAAHTGVGPNTAPVTHQEITDAHDQDTNADGFRFITVNLDGTFDLLPSYRKFDTAANTTSLLTYTSNVEVEITGVAAGDSLIIDAQHGSKYDNSTRSYRGRIAYDVNGAAGSEDAYTIIGTEYMFEPKDATNIFPLAPYRQLTGVAGTITLAVQWKCSDVSDIATISDCVLRVTIIKA